MLVHETLLHGIERAVVLEPLDGAHRVTVGHGGEHDGVAGVNRHVDHQLAIDHHAAIGLFGVDQRSLGLSGVQVVIPFTVLHQLGQCPRIAAVAE